MSSGFIGGVGAGMTRGAGVGGLVMREWYDRRNPPWACCVAQIAGVSSNRMRCRFVRGVGTGVTGIAAISRLSVIKRQYKGNPSRTSGMAQFTGVGSGWVRSRFIRSIGARVTTRAAIASLIMRKWHDQRYPYICRMAGFTQFRSLGMRRGLIRSGTNPVVTASAVAGLPRHRRVIKQDL
jgi:hypothetical protein